jgi:hypothetical protein
MYPLKVCIPGQLKTFKYKKVCMYGGGSWVVEFRTR